MEVFPPDYCYKKYSAVVGAVSLLGVPLFPYSSVVLIFPTSVTASYGGALTCPILLNPRKRPAGTGTLPGPPSRTDVEAEFSAVLPFPLMETVRMECEAWRQDGCLGTQLQALYDDGEPEPPVSPGDIRQADYSQFLYYSRR